MLALVLLAVSNPEIEVPATVAPLSRLLPELGQRANMKLVAGANVRDDVVGIASPKRPVRELMDGIAEAVNASWVEVNDEWVLTRSKVHEDADRKQEVEFRKRAIEKAIALAMPKEPFTELHAQSLAMRRKIVHDESRSAEYYDLHRRSPAGRFGIRIVQAIGAARLAEIQVGRTAVFSTRPTPRQQPLPSSVLEGLYAEFAREQNLYAGAAAKVVIEFAEGGPYGYNHTAQAPSQVDKAIVVARAAQLGSVGFLVTLVDAKGAVQLHADVVFRRDVSHMFEPLGQGKDAPLVHEGWLADYWKGQPWPPEVMKRLRQPKDNEPHALLVEGGIRAWAKVRARPVIALLPDHFRILQPNSEGDQRLTLAMFESAVRVWCEISESKDRVIIRPIGPDSTRRMRTDRAALQAFLTQPEPYPRLTSILDLVRRTSIEQSFLAWRYTDLFRPQILPHMSQWPLLRLLALGSLKESITFGEMNEAQQEFARFLVYEHRRGGGYQPQTDLSTEPTEAFPRDLPPDARLTVTSERESGARVSIDSRYWTVIRPSTLNQFIVDGVDKFKFQTGEFRHYTIRFEVNPKFSEEVEFSDILSLSPDVVTHDKLPAEYRAKLAQQIAEQRRAMGWPP